MILLKFANLDAAPFPVLWRCLIWAVEQWHLGPTAWMPSTPQQGPCPTAVSCLQGRRQEMAHGDRPLPENMCWHRHISLHSHAMLLMFSSFMTSHPACTSLSRLASVLGTWAVANTHDISAAAGETERESYVQHVKPYRLATALKPLPPVLPDVIC